MISSNDEIRETCIAKIFILRSYPTNYSRVMYHEAEMLANGFYSIDMSGRGDTYE